MIHRKRYAFTRVQRDRYVARHGFAPSHHESRLLSGPVMLLDVTWNGHPIAGAGSSKPPAVAMLDTGCDVTTFSMQSMQDWLSVHPSLRLPVPTLGSDGIVVSRIGLCMPSSTQSLCAGDVFVALDPPGYEDILIGRDILDQFTLCLRDGHFSLISPTTVTHAVDTSGLVVPQNVGCCR